MEPTPGEPRASGTLPRVDPAPTPAPEPTADPVDGPDQRLRARVVGALDRRWIGALIAVAVLYAGSVLTPNGQLLSDLVLTGRPTADPDRIAAAKDVLGTVSVASLAVAGLLIAGIAIIYLSATGLLTLLIRR